MNKCITVAEIGINHNGDLKIAKQLIDLAAKAGCDYVKFQKRTIEFIYTKEFLDSPRESPWGSTQRAQKEGLEFGYEDYKAIDSYCIWKDIGWFASPWDIPSVDFLMNFDLPFVKIPSALVTDIPLLNYIKSKNIPVIVSTGMSTKQEVIRASNLLGSLLKYILACTSTYPTKPEEMNLNFICKLEEEFPQCKIGFSNHSSGVMLMTIAIAQGIEMLEFHITLNRSMYGSDQASSIEPLGVHRIVSSVKDIQMAMGDGQWTIFPSEIIIKDKLRNSK